jgi:ferritin-like metal-binding protein YciE
MAGKLSDPRELFLHELGDVLFAEQQLTKILPTLEKESRDAELQKGFKQHLEETERHVQNLEAVFEELGEKPKAEKCPGILGLKQEHDDFMKEEKPSPEIADMFNTGSASRTEHYEIAAYTGLVTTARALGETKAADLLERNLRDEERMLDRVEKIAERLARSQPVEA